MTTEEATLRIDPEFESLIPRLGPEEFRQLRASIRAEGCRDALVVWAEEGILLDGHTRRRICQQQEIPFAVREISLADRDAAKRWIILNQFGRRNLTPYQRAELALKLKPLIASKASERMLAGKPADPVLNSAQGKTRDELAQIAGVGHDTIAKAEFLDQHADDETKRQLRAGETSVNAAYKGVRKVEQRAAKASAKAAVPPDLPAVTNRYTVHHGELSAAGAKVADNSVDWIITDPPYPKEYLPVYDDLSSFAARVLKPGGGLLCMVGQSFLPEVIAQLGKHLTYHWALAYLTPGGQSAQLWERKVNSFWKPLLWFCKGKYEGDWIGDVCRSETNDKAHHHWGQSESGMADIVKRFTLPGQMVCDPFCGGGTTGVVAIRTNRLFIGIDSNQQAVATTLRRLAEAAGA